MQHLKGRRQYVVHTIPNSPLSFHKTQGNNDTYQPARSPRSEQQQQQQQHQQQPLKGKSPQFQNIPQVQKFPKQDNPPDHPRKSYTEEYKQEEEDSDDNDEVESTTRQEYAPKRYKRTVKTHKIQFDKVPRRLIDGKYSIQPIVHQTNCVKQHPEMLTPHIVIDKGLSSPRYIRSSMNTISQKADLIEESKIPLGLLIQPFVDIAEGENEEIPFIDYDTNGPMRCERCNTYVNPYFYFQDNGKSYMCNMCNKINQVPNHYYCQTDMNNRRTDINLRPELQFGTYDIKAPQSYLNSLKIRGIYLVIAVECSKYMIESEISEQVISSIQGVIDLIPSPENTYVSFVTYNSKIDFYTMNKENISDVQIITAGDVEIDCVPLPREKLFFNVETERQHIDKILDTISSIKAVPNEKYKSEQLNPHGCFGAAVNNACEMLTGVGGRVIAFSSQQTNFGFGKLDQRSKVYKEKDSSKNYKALHNDFLDLAKTKCLAERISVDLFLFNFSNFDLPTISSLITITGGHLLYFSNYYPYCDAERLHYGIARNLTRVCAYDSFMKLRVSSGLEVDHLLLDQGKIFESDLQLPQFSADRAVVAMIKHDGMQVLQLKQILMFSKRLESSMAYIQFAILFQTQEGEGRIRVINTQLSVQSDIQKIFLGADQEVVTNILIREHSLMLNTHSPKTINQMLIVRIVDLLYAYRINVRNSPLSILIEGQCSETSSLSALIMPDNLNVLALYGFSALHQSALEQNLDLKPDLRIAKQMYYCSIPGNILVNNLYSKIYPLHNNSQSDDKQSLGKILQNNYTVLPSTIENSMERIEIDGLYLIDNSECVYLYVLREIDQSLIEQLFGVETFEEIQALESLQFIEQSELNVKVNHIIDEIRKQKRGAYQGLVLITEEQQIHQTLKTNIFSSQEEMQVIKCLVEDKQQHHESYIDFLCYVHNLIQQRHE